MGNEEVNKIDLVVKIRCITLQFESELLIILFYPTKESSLLWVTLISFTPNRKSIAYSDIVVVVILTLIVLHLDIASSLVTISFFGHQNDDLLYPILVRQSIEESPISLLKYVGFITFCINYIAIFVNILLFMIMLVSFIYLATMYNTSIPNISRWIYILFKKRSHWDKFVYSIVPLHISLLTF